MQQLYRYVCYFFGLFLITIGINLSIVSGLGVSPVSAFTKPLSDAVQLDLGLITTMVYTVFVLLQAIILGKRFQKKHVLQVPFSMLFGSFINLTGSVLYQLSLTSYLQRVLVLLMSIVICAIGASLYLAMDIVPNPPEGLLLAICERFQLPFAKVKLVTDGLFVLLGILISIGFLGGVSMIREGTIVSVLLTGVMIGYCSKLIRPMLQGIGLNEARVTL